MTTNSNGHISFNSQDRLQVYKPNNIRYENFSINIRAVQGLAVTSYYLCHSTPNINIHNNIIGVDDGILSYSVTLTEGFYDATTFAAEAQTQLNAQAFAGFTVAADPSGTLTVSNSTPFRFEKVEQFNTVNDPANMAGWPYSDTLQTLYTGVPCLVYSEYMDVVSDDLNKYNNLSDATTNKRTSNILCRIYIDDPAPSKVFTKDLRNPKWLQMNKDLQIDAITIKLVDVKGNDYYDPKNNLKYNLLLSTI